MNNLWITYKTNPCKNSESVFGCNQKLRCIYYHDKDDKRRSTDINYQPVLCLESIPDKTCPHESCNKCRNKIEYLYHPDNYKTKNCIYKTRNLTCLHAICPFIHPEDANLAKKIEEIKPFEPTISTKQLPLSVEIDYYVYGEELKSYEDRRTEFKSCTTRGFNVNIAADLVAPYVSAFLNTEGGTLFYGISDNGRVSGVLLTRKLRDLFVLTMDCNINRFTPHLSSDEYSIRFVNVLNPQKVRINDLYVIVIKVNKSKISEIYFTHKNEAFIKRDASISQLKGQALLKFYEKKRDNF